MQLNNSSIAKNTVMLYIRQIIIMLIGLYTVRVVLKQLGIEDYGIYNVIGGVVGLFIFISVTMASATQRFFSYALGKKDDALLKKTFSVNLIVYIGLALLVYILLESVGLWFVKNELVVPVERATSAYWIYHFSALTFVATIVSTPFIAIIIAHEDMQIYAYISIVEALLKLGSVCVLSYVSFDKLELYGVLVLAVAVINSIMYIVVCNRRYAECQFKKLYWDKALLKNILDFTGWTMFGQITSVARNQAITILINQVFNPVVVAARAVANSISGYLLTFSSNFNTGLYPPIIKSYAVGDKEGMYRLVFNGSKMTFFLMWVLSLPILLEMDTILGIWLVDVPQYTVIFTQLGIIEVLINSISTPLMTAARAPGKMKTYELTLGIFQILIFVASWLFLKLGFGAVSIYFIAIIVNMLMFLSRLIIVNKLICLPVKSFLKDVLLPMIIIVIFSYLIAYAFKKIMPENLIYSIVTILFAMILSVIMMYYIGFNKVERIKLTDMVKSKLGR